MDEEWGPWIDGSIAPAIGARVVMDVRDMKGRGDMMHECTVLGFDGDVILISPILPLRHNWQLERYRIRRPQAMRDLIRIAADPQHLPELVPT